MLEGNRNMLSDAMISNETPIVYSTTHNEIIKDESMPSSVGSVMEEEEVGNHEYHYHYYIASSQSQGFQWNQDLFVTQYQQNYQVEYDGHEDSLEETNYHYGIRRYRRRSNNSISFKDDAKNGINMFNNRLLEKYIEGDENDEKEGENGSGLDHFKWLLSR